MLLFSAEIQQCFSPLQQLPASDTWTHYRAAYSVTKWLWLSVHISFLDLWALFRLVKNENEIGHIYKVKCNREKIMCLNQSIFLSLPQTDADLVYFEERISVGFMGALKCLLVCEMTPSAAETSTLVIHCFNHSSSHTSYQPWQGLKHLCLPLALAPFVLFTTLSLSM